MNIVSFALTKRNAESGRGRPAYNLFRRRNEPELYCAVPEDYPVPNFIVGEAWDFGGRLDNPLAAPRGFDPEAARHGVRLSGYYLFLADPAFPTIARERELESDEPARGAHR